MRHLKIHRGLAVRFLRLAADDHGCESGQTGGVGEGVEIFLVGTVEREEHDRLALAGEAGLGERRRVVRLQQPGRASTRLSGRRAEGSPGCAMRCGRVAHDPAQLGDDVVQRRRNRGLLRGGVEHLPLAAPVIVHRHVEGRATSAAAPSTIAQPSPGRHRTNRPRAPAHWISASAWSGSASVTVSCASPERDGPRSCELASSDA